MMKAGRRRFFWCDSQLDSSTVVHKQRQIVALFGPQARRARTAPKGNTGNTPCDLSEWATVRITSRFQPQRLSLVPAAAGCKPS